MAGFKPNVFLHVPIVIAYFALIGVVVHLLDSAYLPLLIASVLGVAVAIHVTKGFFRVFGGWLSANYLRHLGDPLRKPIAMKKFCDQGWFLVLHTVLTLAELVVMADETWWQDTSSCWDYTSVTGAFPAYSSAVHTLYVFQLGMYIYVGFSCEFLEEKRKDHLVMMGHHVVTISLIIWSYAVGYLPIGVIVMFLHDISDIPLDFLKMVNYLKLENREGWFITEFMFAFTLIQWVYFRVYLFPTKLMYSTLYEMRASCMDPIAALDFSILFPSPGPTHWLWFNTLIAALYTLHIWWTFLLMRLLYGVLTVGPNSASKDEYEGHSSDSDAPKTKHD
ncbi:hypothetical protein SDRG_12659 [Saprolegnia diclina VS20]|uniref:TLC domain-containing protein n=1 Tax=Saprolegnia diclina (strain VS20) TaxID=1156394 RepID=T0Q858_SAPDV|nr:hypothetical protein SDRG_12659 [Saprolegnia diclina VS20]EQC29655.1 hypothetical protein SDRG_12659 [Saprolegnia diclina VS20]|eukprot:XP_008616959.1 hypothetical protein SDRG_12659 [Saprolegnia diclina VS20]